MARRRLIGGFISDTWSRRNARARMLVPCSGYLVAAPGLLVLAWSGAIIPALVGLSLYGIARGFFDVNRMPIVRQLVDERYSATAYGFLNLAKTPGTASTRTRPPAIYLPCLEFPSVNPLWR
jgi:dipeptide/tripeptide permease